MEDNMFSRKQPVVDFGALDKAITPSRPTPADFAPRKPTTIAEKRDYLDQLATRCKLSHDDTRRAYSDYLEAHADLLESLASERSKIEEHITHLDKIESSMPRFGESDETQKPNLPSSGRPADVSGPGPSQANVSALPQRHGQALPANRREEVLVPREEPVKGHPDLDIKF